VASRVINNGGTGRHQDGVARGDVVAGNQLVEQRGRLRPGDSG
jgi:hypothetical protein